MMFVTIRALLLWLPMVPIAIGNGILREATYGRRLPELRAHQISTVVGIVLLAIYIRAVFPILNVHSAPQALLAGLQWVALTIAFEFLFGHFVAGHSWARLLRDYNILAGRLWLLVLLWVGIAPYAFYRLLGAA